MLPTENYAVAAKRVEGKDSLDDFPTPPWATRALIEHVIGPECVRDLICWEPAANRGYMARPLQEYFKYVMESDIHDYGDHNVVNFLNTEIDKSNSTINWVITNPPFNKAQQFIEKANTVARDGVAMLVRTSFLEGIMRHQTLFMKNPPDIVAQFAERVPMVRGRCDPKASTATSYCWLVWFIDSLTDIEKTTVLQWIPPCRKTLERGGDYGQ